MKKYIFGIIISIIAIVLIIIGVYFYNIHNNQKILENENNQVEVLRQIYGEYINSFELEESNIILNEDCFKNIITDVEFSDENKEKLKQLERTSDTYDFRYEISSTYSDKTSNLIVEIKEMDEGLMNGRRKYRLYVEDGKIKFESNGLGQITNSMPANI